ncbi:MAG: VCBS repeat-containing protein, partial [Proteobacteria bacterium]|nr:VCBS repeat-containing protein [Pseudomonadota bacterium]
MTPKNPPPSTQPDEQSRQRVRPAVTLSLALVLVTALLAGCGLAGSAASFTASALVPWLLVTSLAAFLVGCGGPRFAGGQPTQGPVTAAPTPTPTPQPQAKALKFITQPTKSTGKSEALTALNPAPQVAVVDESGNTVTGATDAITLSLDKNPSNAVLSGTLTVNAVNGVATFSDVRISLAAAGYTLKASSGSLTADTSVTFVVAPLSPVFLSARSRTDYANGTPVENRLVSSAVTTQVTGDFNGDGHLDVAIAGYYASPSVVVMLGDGEGHLTAPQAVSTSFDVVVSMTAADFNGDGKTDLAVASFKSQQVNVFLSNGDGTFAQGASITGLLQAYGVVSGDFNRDGKTDLAVSLDSNGSGVVQVLLGDGGGSFKATASVSAPAFANAQFPLLTIGRFNGDDIDDLAVTTNEDILTLLGNGDGTFSAGTNTTVIGSGALILPYATHLNGDVNQDLLVNTQDGPNHQLYSLLGDGKGGFTPSLVVPYGYGRDGAAVATDLNGNGKVEIISNAVNVTGQQPSNYALVTLDGGGVKLSAVSSQSIFGYGAPPLLGDFNEDGTTDV